jgi:hypothetical protein
MVLTVEVKEFSKFNWFVEVTEEDKRKIACLIQKLGTRITLSEYGKWKKMTLEELWCRELIGQFCVMRGVRLWENLQKNENNWNEFRRKMKIENLVKQGNLAEYIKNVFKEYKPTLLA